MPLIMVSTEAKVETGVFSEVETSLITYSEFQAIRDT